MPCSGCGSDEAAEDAGCCSKCLSGTRSCCGRFWGGWVDFICQSNIVELAIGVAVGIAFEELIASFTDSFIKPGAGRMKDGHDRPSRSRGCPVATLRQEFTISAFLDHLVSFALTMLVLYTAFWRPYLMYHAHREQKSSAKVESETRIPPDERVILAAILEELKAQNGAAGGKPPTSELPET
ncbi:hypothetical protein EMIHUDRAFT_228873 [Emiliania huxleyi CCMP1516]|uniref:Uncharacterized protein n=2 Tax=Emiliania huxleyi TaxID=2903 RepID=A0A0D3KE39_EMIH1|nr:hypothetical protein EMIHUDRAFT_228873 [Emiliania huxleyi CCMP1516]EOD34024.1 hypothetical protein EMIHUDRAFT_228873 [Emiliania huxleyi CCMP1516]|eukprot:XP_005786453.1 hypothetical protein EMIHUDRAFT_228873 [Emiliania huxleyi CCMP1516]